MISIPNEALFKYLFASNQIDSPKKLQIAINNLVAIPLSKFMYRHVFEFSHFAALRPKLIQLNKHQFFDFQNSKFEHIKYK